MPLPNVSSRNEPTLPFTLRPGKRGVLVLLFASLAFVGLGIAIVAHGDPRGWYAGFFLVGVVTAIAQLHPEAVFLEISREGIRFRNLFQTTYIEWRTIEGFGVVDLRSGKGGRKRGVAISLLPEFRKQGKMQQLTRDFIGFDSVLPDTYGLKPQDLAALLNSYVEEFRKA